MSVALITAAFSAFADHLRDRVPKRSVSVTSVTFDPTFGNRESTDEIEVMDVDALYDAIDSFAERLRVGDIKL